jgi:hypothetical protein
MTNSKSPSDNDSPVDRKYTPTVLNECDASELKKYINSLDPTAQAELLSKLRLFGYPTAGNVNPSKMEAHKNETSFMDDKIKKRLWAASIPTAEGGDKDAAYTRIMNAGGIGSGTIPSHQLRSGFQLTITEPEKVGIKLECHSIVL